MNSSKTRIWSPMTLWRWCLILWTVRSHKPPWWGAADGKKWNSSHRLVSSHLLWPREKFCWSLLRVKKNHSKFLNFEIKWLEAIVILTCFKKIKQKILNKFIINCDCHQRILTTLIGYAIITKSNLNANH